MSYENFNLKDWPFRISADENFASIWAGRAQTKIQLEGLLNKMTHIPMSGLHIFWANFGMGKTHTLYHLKYRSSQTAGQIIPIYAVMPKRSTGFLELYREIVQAFLTTEMRDYLGRQLMAINQNTNGASVALNSVFSKSPGVVKALLAMRNGDIEQTTAAMQWLTAQPGLPAPALRAIGVTYRIHTQNEAIAALYTLIKLSLFGGTKQKQVFLMIDEFQNVGELRPNIRSQINSSLHTIFNAHQTGLQLLLTFSVGKRENVEYLLSGELKSRAAPQSINLDVLNCEESAKFLSDLLGQFRINKEDPRRFYPLSEMAVNTMLTMLEKKKPLTPRRIMQYTDYILSQHLENSNEITGTEVETLLNTPELGSLDMDSDSS